MSTFVAIISLVAQKSYKDPPVMDRQAKTTLPNYTTLRASQIKEMAVINIYVIIKAYGLRFRRSGLGCINGSTVRMI